MDDKPCGFCRAENTVSEPLDLCDECRAAFGDPPRQQEGE